MQQQQRPFNGLWSGTTRVGRYQKEHSPTPLLQTPHGHLAAFWHTIWRSPLIITLVLFILTLMPLLSTFSFHSFSLLISSSSVPLVWYKFSHWSSGHKSPWNLKYWKCSCWLCSNLAVFMCHKWQYRDGAVNEQNCSSFSQICSM